MSSRLADGLGAAGLRFPIPMRGNECTAAVPTVSVTPTFPIPMRGNELLVVGLWSSVLLRFPIPMRGNESGRRSRRVKATMFPIPMRGNEDDISHTKTLVNGDVSDPHEG